MDIDIADAEYAVAECIHHIKNWIDLRDSLPERGQEVYGVKHSAKVCERRQDKRRYDGDIIKTFGIYCIDQAGQ